MPTDALMTVAAPGVKTATFNSAALTLPKATMLNPLFCRIIYSAASNVSGANAVTFDIDVSYDGGSTWSELSGAPPIALSTTVGSGEISIPFQLTRADLVQAQVATQPAPQIRVTGTFSGAGSTPTINVTSIAFQPGRV